MRTRDYLRKTNRRIARAESDANATIMRAFDRVLRLLEHERTELLIHRDRGRRLKPKGGPGDGT